MVRPSTESAPKTSDIPLDSSAEWSNSFLNRRSGVRTLPRSQRLNFWAPHTKLPSSWKRVVMRPLARHFALKLQSICIAFFFRSIESFMSLTHLRDECHERIADLSSATILRHVKNILEYDDIVLIVGSAVSIFGPTGMPSGIQVTSSLARHFSFGLSDKLIIESEIKKAAFETIFQCCPDRAYIENLFVELYDKTTPNIIHKSISNLRNDRPYDIITPNYDRCIELSSEKWNVIVSQCDYSDRSENYRLFKLHGSINFPDTMIFTINAESPLEGWKRDLFNEITNGKTLIIVGYSGLDFEICPAILSSSAKAILWNFRSNISSLEFPSQNASHIFKNDDRCLAILGDMRSLFSVKADVSFGESQVIIDNFFKKLPTNIYSTWRVRLLDSLGLCWQAKKALELDRENIDERDALQIEIGIDYRFGLYIDSARKCIEESRRFLSGFHSQVYGYSGAAFRYRNYGDHRTARALYGKAIRAWLRLDSKQRAETRLSLLWLGTLIRLKDPRKQSKALRLAQEMAILCLKKGQWGQYYLVQPLLKRHDIDIAARVGINAPLLPAQQGFLHIGNLSSRIDDSTYAMKDTRPSKFVILKLLARAKKAKLYPNLWKCALGGMIYSKNTNFHFQFKLMILFLIGICRCQYSMRTKFISISVALLSFIGITRIYSRLRPSSDFFRRLT